MSRHEFAIRTTARPDGAQLSVSHRGRVCVIRASGEIDIVNAERWRQSLTSLVAALPANTTGLVIDLTGVALLSAFGMRSLLAARAMAPEGIRVVVVARSSIRRALDVVDSTRQLVVASELDAVLAGFNDG